ncbi:MAG: hypothetical protein ACI9TV_003222 [Sulfurimonas sp.]|jgi:hypothetical protein|uniref:hypothetical protein n=1 Tax=Sulfurimonas sp. TaxID=2022749 RepID=UPI0039E5CABD
MSLIEIFTDYIYDKKDLREYVKQRKNINERGEFNDASLIEAQENLERLKKEDILTYNAMYDTLREYVKLGHGEITEYPINFIREFLKLYKGDYTVKKMYENYKSGLKHYHHDA